MFLLLLMPEKLALGKVAIYLLAALRVSSQENEHWQFFFSTSSCQTYGNTVYFTTQSHADCINALQFYKVIYVALN